MSASDKKKLRKEQYAEKMTKRQKAQRSENRKLAVSTVLFVVAMVAILGVLAVNFGITWYRDSGYREKHSVVATIGDYELNAVEFAYYYNDAINEFYSQINSSEYADYMDLLLESMGIDPSLPLDQQTNPETGDTWANYFIDTALDNAKSDIAIYNKAMEAGFVLSEEDQAAFDSDLQNMINNVSFYSTDIDTYLKQVYGCNGVDIESYTEYLLRKEISQKYAAYYYESLTYTDEELRDYEADKYINYNSYDYAYVYLSHKVFLEGGTTTESGSTEYSAEENDAAREKMADAAEYLIDATSVEELNEMIENVEVSEGSSLVVRNETGDLYTDISGISTDLAAWISEEDRTEGDTGMIEISAEETDEDGETITVVNGIYVVIYLACDENNNYLSNVRHILIAPQGSEVDAETGEAIITDQDWSMAETEAKALLDSWKNGEANEESFIALVADNTDDTGSAETGGLYENIGPNSEYVPEFLAWAIDPERKAGDVDIVQTEYGYHIMYYVGPSEHTYRDTMIIEELRYEDYIAFENGALEATIVTKKDLTFVNTSMVLAG